MQGFDLHGIRLGESEDPPSHCIPYPMKEKESERSAAVAYDGVGCR
nr:MAG TPA: hypothetical protein [Caudoviricetes sp.]